MGNEKEKDQKQKSNYTPEQKLGDTPVPPWEMPTPEEKEEAKPVRRALEEAVEQVDSQAEADEVIEDLDKEIGEKTAAEIAETERPVKTTTEAAQKVQAAERTARGTEETEEVLEETARVLAASDRRPKEAVSEAVQEVLNPEQQGAEPTEKDARRREYLRQAVLKRLKPLDALDANLFLAINHLPHTHVLNTFFYGITLAWQGAAVWYAEMGLKAIQKRWLAGRIFRYMALPLTITGLLVELPIKSFFRRRRPFITIIQAIVIGKKPGTWSFPSGHAAGAFAGAWLLNQRYPRGSLLRYIFASLVGFSRIYLGDHYPGDVASGSLIGLLFAMFFRKQAKRLLK